MKLRQVIANIKSELEFKYGTRETEWMIRDIMEYLKGYSAVDIVLHREDEVSLFITNRIKKIIMRLLENEPLQYILGEARFCGHKFKVTPATLIPRPETQELVDMIVKENQQTDLSVLDIGTGSGCIAISLARALKFPKVRAIDISPAAIDVAKENAINLKVKVDFIEKDMLQLDGMEDSCIYDIIVSNPPYIAESESSGMDANVLDYEPATALFVPDDNPLLFYKAITDYACYALKPEGRLYFEINPRYVNELSKYISDKGFSEINVYKDMQARNRFITATRNG